MVTFFLVCVLFFIISFLVSCAGNLLNRTVMRANDGCMPVVRNRPDDTENFGNMVHESDRHVWADKNTKLVFLADWINIPAWHNAPYSLILYFERMACPLWTPKKVSIGDLCLWGGFILSTFTVTIFVAGILFIGMEQIILYEPN